jgi:hypothetical protein
MRSVKKQTIGTDRLITMVFDYDRFSTQQSQRECDKGWTGEVQNVSLANESPQIQ